MALIIPAALEACQLSSYSLDFETTKKSTQPIISSAQTKLNAKPPDKNFTDYYYISIILFRYNRTANCLSGWLNIKCKSKA